MINIIIGAGISLFEPSPTQKMSCIFYSCYTKSVGFLPEIFLYSYVALATGCPN